MKETRKAISCNRQAVALAATLLLMLFAGAWFYSDQERAYRERIADELAAVARIKTGQIEEWRNDQIKDADLLVKNPLFHQSASRFLSHPQAQAPDSLLALLRLFQQNNDCADILLVDPGGRIRLSLNGCETKQIGYMATMGKALQSKRPEFTDLHIDTLYPDLHLSITTRFSIGEDPASPAGAVIQVLDAATFLFPMIRNWPTHRKTAEALLARKDGGNVVFLTNLRHRPDAALNLRLPLQLDSDPAVMAASGQSGFVIGRDYRGTEVAASILPVPDSNWFMVVKIDTVEAFSGWRFRSTLMLSLMLGMIGLAGTISLLIRQREQKNQYRALYAAESALRSNAERHSVILNAVDAGVIATDSHGRVELVNPEAELLTGWKGSEARGRLLSEIFRSIDSDTREPVDNPAEKALSDGRKVVFINHTLLVSRDGSERHVTVSAAPVRDEKGENTGAAMVFRDVTTNYLSRQALQQSEENYRKLFEDHVAVKLIIDPDTYAIIDANWAAASFYGWTREELRRMKIQDINTLPHAEIMAEMNRALNLNRIRFEFRHRRADGGIRDVEVFSSKIQVKTRTLLHSIVHDITDRKKAERDRERLAAAIDQVGEAIVITDCDALIRYVNPTFEQISGFGREEVLGRNPRFLKSGLQGDGFYREMWRTLISGQTWQGRLVNKRKNGDLYTEETVISPVLNPLGVIDGYVSIKRDITRDLELEQRMLQAQKMEAIGTLAGGIAHDFNNILFPIIGFSEMLLQDLPPEDKKHEQVDEIYRAALRASDLVGQILSFSRQSEERKLPIRIHPILKEVVKLIRSTIPANIEITSRIQNHCGRVLADPTQIHQIVMNLVTNAYHAVDETGGTITVVLQETEIGPDNLAAPALTCGKFARISVSDTGVGIDKAILDKIFEPYFTTKERGKGTGLGLSIVHGIVTESGGHIHVTSQAGKGTTFDVYLPIMTGDDEEDTTKGIMELPRGNERVFLVEDEEPIARMVTSFLQRLGYQVHAFTDSIAALESFRKHPEEQDLVITDMAMPRMTGLQLAEELLAVRPGIPIIICTGFSEKIDRGRCDDLGIKGLMMKPVLIKELALLIRRLLGGCHS